MSVYAITYYLNEETHSCGCGEHDHDHNHEHEHHHEHEHEHHHEVRDDYEIVGNIKTLGSWACFMPDSYLVKTDLTASEISNKLKSFLEPKDLLFVTKVDKDDVASLTPGVVEWISK